EHLTDDFFLDLPTDVPLPVHPEPDDLASQYQACGGNISYLARHLGLSRNTLYKRLREQGVRP
ncbi:MAG: helix-turn-helix domain-containing protein, partial [Pseudomonas sp.]|nr:helix-turn-helix domain-containing protein [Pseudomonas sp.]